MSEKYDVEGKPEQYAACMRRVPKSCDDKHFDAVLAKNEIARLMNSKKFYQKRYKEKEMEFTDNDIEYILIRLRAIENFIGTLNQPSAEDEYNSKY